MVIPVLLCCKKSNDIYKIIVSLGISVKTGTPEELAKLADENNGILLLSDSYPAASLELNDKLLSIAEEKKIRIFAEFPKSIARETLPEAVCAEKDRLFITKSGEIIGKSTAGTILTAHSFYYQPVTAEDSYVSAGKVAGYDTLPFGIPEKRSDVLYKYNPETVIFGTGISNAVTARYAPYEAWRSLIGGIVSWVTHGRISENSVFWTPVLRPVYGKNDLTPAALLPDCFSAAADWFERECFYCLDEKRYAIEGWQSVIDVKGNQLIRISERADCMAESAMVMMLSYGETGQLQRKKLAEDVFFRSILDKEYFNSEDSGSIYGLINWFRNAKIFYGDDNARILLAFLTARNSGLDDRFDEKILRCVIGNLRTSYADGIRKGSLKESDLNIEDSWKRYFTAKSTFPPSPHYHSYIIACYLWVYMLTGEKFLLEFSENTMKTFMDTFYSGWKWTNSLTAELARIIFPLAFLVRAHDTPEHREWLRKSADELLSHITPCGALQDTLGDMKMGSYPPPSLNEDYGKSEASLIQRNGDPATDLLYALNWAFIGLHEASFVLPDKDIAEAADKMAEFLCRIQLTGENSRFRGCWMRSFDYEKWEYYGSSADAGWGAWCVETGWTNAWIAAGIYLRSKNKPFYNESASESFRNLLPGIMKEMLWKEGKI